MSTKRVLILDVESTIKATGNPFHHENKLCLVGLKELGKECSIYDVEHSSNPYGLALQEIQERIESADLLVGFNIKFDLHWIRRYINGIHFPAVWDCQLGEFILSRQTNVMPSLGESCTSRGLGSKSSVVESEYWKLGIDTDAVPRDVLDGYLAQDLTLTEKLYVEQEKELEVNKLFRLHCADLLCLQEMEYNGMLYDVQGSNREAAKYDAEITRLNADLDNAIGVPDVNWSSNSHISAILYGGTIRIPCIVSTERVLKSGEIKYGTKQGTRELIFPQLVKPPKRSETKQTCKLDDTDLFRLNARRITEGLSPFYRTYSVDKGTLRSLKAKGKAKEIIDLLLRRSEVDKLLTTYFRGIPQTMADNGWNDGIIHGQFNQCVARTGRLSSSKPNLQNVAGSVKELFRSRYE